MSAFPITGSFSAMQNQIRPQNMNLSGTAINPGMQRFLQAGYQPWAQQAFPTSPGLQSALQAKWGQRPGQNPTGAGTPNPYQAPAAPTLDEQTAQGPPDGYSSFERSGSPGLPGRAYYQDQGAQNPQMQPPPPQAAAPLPTAQNPKFGPWSGVSRFLRGWPGPVSQTQTQFPGGAPGGGI